MGAFEKIKEGFTRGFEKTPEEKLTFGWIKAIREKISKLSVGDDYYYPECEEALKTIITKNKKKIRSGVRRLFEGMRGGLKKLASI